jgi:inner membrane protein
MDTHQQPYGFWDNNRVLIKGILVGILILVMMIPQVFVSNLVYERQERQTQVVNEVSSKWAARQTITGPVLMLPYLDSGAVKQAYVLPEELKINGTLQPTQKKRSLYNVMLYSARLTLDGRFGPTPLQKLGLRTDNIIWKDARIVVSLDDMHGLTDQVTLNWNGTSQQMEAGVPNNDIIDNGMSIPVTIDPQNPSSFSISMNLRGSDHLNFIPAGKTTEVNLTAAWKDPKFDGLYLPETSDIGKQQFTAHWKIMPLTRNYPECWKSNHYDMHKAAFGVGLIQPVDGYAKTNRSVKYAILFIALTFTFFFFLEIIMRRKIHPIQYILVGMALTIFYTLLLSISEYTGFDVAYLIAAAATVGLISSYVWGIFKRMKTAVVFTAALSGLYGYIYILIQLEDYALLFGSIGLFLILAVIMHYSRKIDWYGNKNKPADTIERGSWRTAAEE